MSFQNKHSWNICLSYEPETHPSLSASTDFKPKLLQRYVNPLNAGDNPVVEEDTEGAVSEDPEDEGLPILNGEQCSPPAAEI